MSIVAIGILIAFLIVILMNVGGFITQIMGMILYSIAIPLMWILDFVQMLFRKLAGLDTTWVKADGVLQQQDGDILLSLITNKTVLQVLLAMTLVGIVLLIITTIIQMIRTEYTTEGSKNNKGTIIGTALKAFAYFFIVPIACVFGIIVANYVLKALDVATSAAGARTVSGSVFVAAASDANRVRKKGNSDATEGWYLNLLDGPNTAKTVQYNPVGSTYTTALDRYYFSVNDTGNRATNAEAAAEKVDAAFSKGSLMMVLVQGGPTMIDESIGDAELENDFIAGAKNMRYFSYDNVITVVRYYNPADINYLMLYVGLALCIWTLFKAAFGMIKRMYKATMLFIISPGIIGIWPLDGGNAFKSWRSQFISSVLSAYGVVIALNLFFVIAGAVDKIYLFKPYDAAYYNVAQFGGAISFILGLLLPPLITLINNVMRGLFIIVGALMVSEMASTISQLIGAGDALKEGGEMVGKVTSAVGKGAMVAMGAGALAGKMAKGIGGKVKNASNKSKLADLQDKEKNGGLTDKEKEQKAELEASTKEYADTHGIRGMKNRIASSVTGMSTKDRNRMKLLSNKENLSNEEKEELGALKAKKQSITAARDAQGTAMIKGFFQQSSMGKALNTMTGGMVPAFGGDAWAKAGKAAQEAHPELKSDFAARDDAASDIAKERKGAAGAAARADARDHYSAAKDLRKAGNELVDGIAKALVDGAKELKEAIASGDKEAEGVAREKIGNALNSANKVGAIDDVATDQLYLKAGLAKTEADVDGLNLNNIDFSGARANIDNNAHLVAEGKISTDDFIGKLGPAFDKAAESLSTATGKLVEGFTQAAERIANTNIASASKGSPEVAINALSSKLGQQASQEQRQNAQIIKLLNDLVHKSK